MTSPTSFWDVPALRPLAPLVLAAWDDAFLTPAELLSIRDALERATGDDLAARDVLRSWLDPDRPPSAHALRTLERAVFQAPASVPIASSAADSAPSWRGAASPEQRDLLVSLEAQRAPRTAAVGGKRGAPTLPPSAAQAARESSSPPSAAEIERWRTALDGPKRDVRDRVRQLLADNERFRAQRDLDMRAYREQVLGWVCELGKLDLIASGGAGSITDVGAFLAAFETISLFDLSLTVKFGVQYGLFAGAIQNLGTERHHAMLPKIARCELIGCFAMTERAHGSNVRALQTIAHYEPATKEFVIHTPSLAAGKEWIGNAALHARMAVVFAQLETLDEQYGVHAFVVPIRSDAGELLPGVRAEDCGHKMGLNGVDNGRLWFDRVRVPREALLDRFAQVAEDGTYSSPIPSAGKRFFSMLGTLVGGRINVAGGALAASKVGLAIALNYGTRRRQFADARGIETPIFDYLTHRQRLLPGLAAAYAYSFAQHALVKHVDEAREKPDRGRDIGTLAAGLKALGTWQAIETLQNCRECCGGQGYLTSNRIDALRTDADVFATFEGDNNVLLQLVAKDLLRLRLRSFQENPVGTIARSVVAGIGAALSEKNPLTTRRTDEASLRSPEFHRQALRQRERSLEASLSARVKRRVDQGMNAQEAFESCQDHAIALAHAHVESFVLESFQQAAASDRVLEPLCALFGLSRIAHDLAWFLEDDYLASSKSRAIRTQINELLAELAPHALPLVEAFAIPSTCLGPLADPAYLRDSGLASE